MGHATFDARHVIIDPKANTTAVTIIIYLRPNLSVIFPLNSVPKTAPINTVVVTYSVKLLLSAQPLATRRKGRATEIMPVLNSNKRPPLAAIREINTTFVFDLFIFFMRILMINYFCTIIFFE